MAHAANSVVGARHNVHSAWLTIPLPLKLGTWMRKQGTLLSTGSSHSLLTCCARRFIQCIETRILKRINYYFQWQGLCISYRVVTSRIDFEVWRIGVCTNVFQTWISSEFWIFGRILSRSGPIRSLITARRRHFDLIQLQYLIIAGICIKLRRYTLIKNE